MLKIIKKAKEDMLGTSNNPTKDHLFDINDNPQLLDENTKTYFHTMTSKVLFLSKSSSPDLQKSPSFLKKRVKGI